MCLLNDDSLKESARPGTSVWILTGIINSKTGQCKTKSSSTTHLKLEPWQKSATPGYEYRRVWNDKTQQADYHYRTSRHTFLTLIDLKEEYHYYPQNQQVSFEEFKLDKCVDFVCSKVIQPNTSTPSDSKEKSKDSTEISTIRRSQA